MCPYVMIPFFQRARNKQGTITWAQDIRHGATRSFVALPIVKRSYPTCCPLVRFSHIAPKGMLLREHRRCCARRAIWLATHQAPVSARAHFICFAPKICGLTSSINGPCAHGKKRSLACRAQRDLMGRGRNVSRGHNVESRSAVLLGLGLCLYSTKEVRKSEVS